MLAAQIRNRNTGLVLLQYDYDLFFRKSVALHLWSFSWGQSLLQPGLIHWGNVSLFLARISKGRTIREFVVGAVIAPAIMCFVWFAFAGGTAIDMELTGVAGGAINSVPDGDEIFAMTDLMLSPVLGWLMAVLIVVLLMTYLVTSADSAVLIVNTINAAGDEGPKARPHILFWGITLGLVVAALLLVGGLKAIQTAMVIGALPFSLVMVLMCVSLFKAIYRDSLRERAGLQTVYE